MNLKDKDYYNIALDCIDKHAQSLTRKHHSALIYIENEQGISAKRETRLSFSALEGLTNRLANSMQSRGLKKGDRVIIRLNNSPQFPISFIAIIKCGAIPIPTSSLFTWEELKFIIEDSEAKFLITEETLYLEEFKTLSNSPQHSINEIWNICSKEFVLSSNSQRWQDLLKAGSANFSTQPTLAKEPAYWLYTSGTTGKPKAVIHSHASIRAHDSRAKIWQNIQEGDIVFNTSALNWSYALTAGLLDIWRHGQTSLIYQGELSADILCHLIQKHKVTTFMSVPGIYRRLNRFLKNNPQHFSRLRVCLSAGESLQEQIEKEFYQYTKHHIYEGLGMTEHSVYLIQSFKDDKVPKSIGKPPPGQKVTILNEDLQETQAEEVGCLATHHSCEGLFLGYHEKKKQKPQLILEQGWFLSGDLAKRDQKGNFFFLGRKDDILTVGGYKIAPLEVEQILQKIPQVLEAAILSKAISSELNILEALLVLNPGVQPSNELKKEILEFCHYHLAKYKIPQELIWVKELPKNARGKLIRQHLKNCPY